MNGILFKMKNLLALLESSKNLIVGKTIQCLLFKIIGFISLSTSQPQPASSSRFTWVTAPEVSFVIVRVFSFVLLFSLPPPLGSKVRLLRNNNLKCSTYSLN